MLGHPHPGKHAESVRPLAGSGEPERECACVCGAPARPSTTASEASRPNLRKSARSLRFRQNPLAIMITPKVPAKIGMAIRIQALGTLRVERDGEILDRLPAKRVRCGVLVYLATERSATREQLMNVFWGDRPPDRARHLLNQTLYELRQDLDPDWVATSGDHLHVADHVRIDVDDFTRAVEAGDYDSALSLYEGPLLGGAAPAVSRALEGWFDTQHARLVRAHRQARRGAIDARVDAGSLRDALALARDWVELDPLDDEAQHRLIELMAATGDRSGALRQYDRYARLVEKELELDPLDETRELVERIRTGEVGQREAPAAPAGPSRVAEPRPAYAAEAAGAASPDPAPEAAGRDRRSQAEEIVDSLRHLRRRKVVQWTFGYFAGALVVLEGMSNLADAFEWPGVVLRMVTLLLGFGALVVLGYAWVSSESRRQRIDPIEAMLVMAVLVFAGFAANAARQPVAVVDAARASAERLDQRRVAVLFFQDYSPTQDMAPLAAGFTQALITELSQVDGLQVLSSAAVSPYRGSQTPLDSIVRDLRAGTLVTGSITTTGERLHLTYELIDGATRNTIHMDTLQRPMSEIAALVAQLPQEVAISLRTQLGGEIELHERRLRTTSSEAWTLVQRAEAQLDFGEDVWRKDLEAGLLRLERADSMLARAERLDPEWPDPVVRRAEVAANRARRTGYPAGSFEPEATRAALAHLERALRRRADHPPALEVRGLLRFELAEIADADTTASRLYGLAERDLQRAVDIDPSRAAAWWGLSKLHRRQGSFVEAKADATRALDADAFLASALDNLFQMFYTAFELEEHGEAVYWCDELHNRFPDRSTGAYCKLWIMGSVDVLEPDVDSARVLARRVIDAATTDVRRQQYVHWTGIMVAKTHARAGRPAAARAMLSEMFDAGTPDYAAYDAAHAWLMLGETQRALNLLQDYVEFLPGRRGSLATDWYFEALHGDPRFQRLIGAPGPG